MQRRAFPSLAFYAKDRHGDPAPRAGQDGRADGTVLLAAANLLSLDEKGGPVAAVVGQEAQDFPLLGDLSEART